MLFRSEGNTAKVAKEIARQTGAALYEIKEAEPYPSVYRDCIKRAQKELQSKARPAIKGDVPDLSEYKTVYLGYPNWWGDAPMVVYTFLEKAKIDGKAVLPFCTHEGSGLGSTARNLAKAFPKAKVEQKGLQKNFFFQALLRISEPRFFVWNFPTRSSYK